MAEPSEPEPQPGTPGPGTSAPGGSGEPPAPVTPNDRHAAPQGMLPARERRRSVLERGFMRLLATGGIVGVATILGAVLVHQHVAGWIVGLAVGVTSVVLAALLWSSRQL